MNTILKFIIYRLPILAIFLRRVRGFINAKRKPTKTKFGFFLKGNKLMESGDFEVEETSLITKLICNVDVFINVVLHCNVVKRQSHLNLCWRI